MSIGDPIRVTLKQETDFAFRIQFDETDLAVAGRRDRAASTSSNGSAWSHRACARASTCRSWLGGLAIVQSTPSGRRTQTAASLQ
ncbi:hypothetical protein [Xanthomonas sp. SI]|uniref:hypothetical protein n=1 Tax=Xanthomonas sp. SI TaxID=2724123 RepID=UPI00210560B1|nr:hypothetical protein [Xanthomonas sp. SI]